MKNKTSTVAAVRSIQHIEDVLARYGASDIVKRYRDGKVGFILPMPNDTKMSFKLPARVENIERILKANVTRPTPTTYKTIADQAERTAWKLLSDWVDILEVMMPYIYDPATDKTFFERVKDNPVKLLK